MVNEISIITNEIEESTILFKELTEIIQQSKQKVSVLVNSTLTELYWHIGGHITQFFLTNGRAAYGKSILQSVTAKLNSSHE